MVAPKKGQGIAFKIPGQEGGADGPADPSDAPKESQAKTGVGMLSRLISVAQTDNEEVKRLSAENERLKLEAGETLIDPRQIVLTRWADRHPDSFSSPAFLELKEDIRQAGGNVQPIKVRPVKGTPSEPSSEPRYELVYGSRRTRACLELGLHVRAVVDANVDDQGLYVQMQRENRGRANLSAWEQGVSYHKALSEGLFPSARRLAESIGLDHSNMAKALRVAELPEEIVGAFRSPCDIQFRWAVALDKALQRDAQAVRTAARRMANENPRPKPQEVFRALTQGSAGLAAKAEASEGERVDREILVGGKRGVIRSGKGGSTTIELEAGVVSRERWAELEVGLLRLLKEIAES